MELVDSMKTLHVQVDATDFQSVYTDTKEGSTDSGYDLYTPETIVCEPGKTTTINFQIRCEPVDFIGGYLLVPRSSISATPLRLANSVGIIDCTYRQNIMAKVDNTGTIPYVVEKGTRLFQICMANLKPFQVRIVGTVSTTARGGFGSTGV